MTTNTFSRALRFNRLLRQPFGFFKTAAVCLGSILLTLGAHSAVPAPEKLLPDDTLFLTTIPDMAKMRVVYKRSPESQFWNDPAMKPFREKFMNKLRDELLKPLERELDVRFDDYTNLLQGQVTLAITQNGWKGSEEQVPAVLLLLDAREQSGQLKTNLANVRKKWIDSGKSIKTEKILSYEFSIVPLSTNDMPKSLQKFMPTPTQSQDSSAEDEPKKSAPKTELAVGQVDSLLIVGTSTKAIEKVVAHMSGGSTPALADLAAYSGNHQSFFRDAPLYGWVNIKAFVDVLLRVKQPKGDSAGNDPFAAPSADKIITATGLGGLKTLAFAFQNSNEGSFFQIFLGAPESTRQGLFKFIAGEPKESNPPQFVPADAVKFQRWRIDGQKAWAALEKMLGDLSPQAVNALNFVLDTANRAAKEKDPDFDVRKNLIGNLGDDLITYEKKPSGDQKSAPSLILIGSPHPDQLAAALKGILAFLGQQGGAPTEREFLGRKIYTVPLPALPIPIGGATAQPGAPRTLSYSTSSTYVAMSTDASTIEEYLRSSDSKGKALRETAGLSEAAQKVTGPGTGLFGYENQAETMRVAFETLKNGSGSSTNSGFAALPGAAGIASPASVFKDWMDFSLLPAYDKISKYFNFTVYGASASVDGLTFKMFSPVPPQLRSAK